MRSAALPASKPRLRDMRIYRQTAGRQTAVRQTAVRQTAGHETAGRGIHLVRVSATGEESPAELRELGDAWMVHEHARMQRRLRLAAMALGASFAPGIWLAHALLVHLHIL